MQLLRDNSETLLTILEVLLCDPLYSWTVTTNQQNTANRNTTVHGKIYNIMLVKYLPTVYKKKEYFFSFGLNVALFSKSTRY